MGYTFQEIVDAVGEADKIKESRRMNMKGRFDNFKSIFQLKTQGTLNTKARSPRTVTPKMA